MRAFFKKRCFLAFLMLPVILGLSGPRLLAEERGLLADYPPTGIILFARNIEEPAQLADFIASIREVVPGAKLVVDQEGGRVARLRPPHWPVLPAAGTLGSAEAAYEHGLALGSTCNAAGFDVVTAPVLDVSVPGADLVIGDRAISGDARTVAALGGKIAEGILAAGCIPVMKHAPGHGRAMVDSHKTLPRVASTDLSDDLYPFSQNAHLPWAMTAHIVYEALDPENPATLSRIVIRDVIRRRIGFAGTLISDDLAMHALTGAPEVRALAALAAGCDVALYCTGVFAENAAILRALQKHG